MPNYHFFAKKVRTQETELPNVQAKGQTTVPANIYIICGFNYHTTSIKRRVPNNRRFSNKRRGFEACDLINAGSQINTRVI